MTKDQMITWLEDCAEFFQHLDAKGEDMQYWANVYNSENARKIAQYLKFPWQPIETAPKDEEIYLIAITANHKIPGIIGYDTDDGWYWFNGMFKSPCNPTHWMPYIVPIKEEE